MKERDEVKMAVRHYRFVLLRIRFPDGLILQGTNMLSDVPLNPGKVTTHESNKRIVTQQSPNADVCTKSSEWYNRIVPLMGGSGGNHE